MWYPTSMYHGPRWTSCQSTNDGWPALSRKTLPTWGSPWITHHGVAVDTWAATALYASYRRCGSRTAPGTPRPIGPPKLLSISASPRVTVYPSSRDFSHGASPHEGRI